MIIKSNPITSNSLPSDIFNYCTANSKNESVEVLNGEYQDVADCFHDAHDWNRKNSLLHMQISSKEPLTNEQFLNMRERVKKEFNLSDSDIVTSAIHEYTRKNDPEADPRHLHLLIRMINPENGKPLDLSNKYQRQEKISRMFEIDNNLELVQGRHNRAVFHNVPDEYKDKLQALTVGDLPNSFLRDGQYQSQRRNGGKPFDIKNEAREILSRCDSFQAFQNAIAEKGWAIEQGTKKLILNDENGKFVGSLDRVLGMKKQEFQNFIDGHEIQVASPILSRTSDDVPTTNKLARVAPVDPSQKPTEHTPGEAQEQTTQPQQTSPQSPEIGSGTDTTNEAKAEASDGMSREEKLAVNEFNKEQNEKEKLLKESLANQKKFAQQMLDDMKQNKKPELKPTWSDTLDDREKILVDIIDQPHPKLRTITNKQVRNFLYKNFKDELDEFFDKRKTLRSIQSDIKDLKENAYFFKNKRVSNKEKKEEEERKKLILLAMYIVHCMMHKIGLNQNKPVAFDYLTDEQKNNYKLEYEKDKYAKLLFENHGCAKCLDAIAFMKVFERNCELNHWKNRDEVFQAKLAMQKLDIVRDVNIYSLDQQGQDEFRKAQENLDIEKARKAVVEAHKRENQKYLLDIREPEKTQEKEEKIEQNQDNDKEKSNVVQFPKNSNQKKKKHFLTVVKFSLKTYNNIHDNFVYLL